MRNSFPTLRTTRHSGYEGLIVTALGRHRLLPPGRYPRPAQLTPPSSPSPTLLSGLLQCACVPQTRSCALV